ncbi:MAG: RNA polymerase sigma factor, partial [Cellulosilyticaceae bacterium]
MFGLEGKRKAIECFVLEHQDSLYRTAFSYVKHQEIAMDLVQDSIVAAFEKSYSLRQIEMVKPWFYKILINKCMSTLRKNKSRVQLAVPEQSAWDEEHIDWATTLSLHASVEQLDIKLK